MGGGWHRLWRRAGGIDLLSVAQRAALGIRFGLGAGFILFLALSIRMRPKFKCPQCGSELGRETALGKEDGEQIRFVCAACQIEWESGTYVPRSG